MMNEYIFILDENADDIKEAISGILNLKRKEEKDKYFDTIYTLSLNKYKELIVSNPQLVHIYKDIFALDSFNKCIDRLNKLSNIFEEKVPGNWVSGMLNKVNDIVADIKECDDDIKFTDCIFKCFEIFLDSSYYLSTNELGISVDEDDINEIKNTFENDDIMINGLNFIKELSLEDFDNIYRKSVDGFDKIIELVKTL